MKDRPLQAPVLALPPCFKCTPACGWQIVAETGDELLVAPDDTATMFYEAEVCFHSCCLRCLRLQSFDAFLVMCIWCITSEEKIVEWCGEGWRNSRLLSPDYLPHCCAYALRCFPQHVSVSRLGPVVPIHVMTGALMRHVCLGVKFLLLAGPPHMHAEVTLTFSE